MFASSNSSHSTPRGAPADRAPMPPFVVTSSNDTPYAHAATPVKATTTTAALNPEAREFRITPSFGGSLFALPATSSSSAQSQSRWPPTAPFDFPCRPSSTGSHVSSPPPPATAAAETLDGARLVELTEAYMHEVYDRRCKEEGLHMVSVFHLHPRTTNKQLSSVFFPTGASAAEVLEPRGLPEPLANAFHLVRQRAGVVFFARKDFAMVGVEKIHDFVPHGQHQPLVVRYCGPDGRGTPQSVLALPAKELSPPSARRTPPQATHRDVPNLREHSLPVTTAAPAPLPPLPPLDRLAGADAAANASSTYDVIDQHFLKKYAGENVFLVGVHNLAYGTSGKSFYKMFYPMGALDSELLPRPVSFDGKLRCSGVAIFASKGMAIEAAEKINDFVPHGQRRPVVARFLERTSPSMLDVEDARVGDRQQQQQQQQQPVATASTPRANAAAPHNAGVAATSSAALLLDIERQLRSKAVSDAQLAADMCALVLCNDSGEAEAAKLANILRDALQATGDHSTVLSSPLSGAFRTMHSTLGIRTRTAPPGPADTSAVVKKAITFLQLIGRTFMMLVADTAAARQTRIVAAVQCAYLYQYTYLPKTPLSFATILFQSCARELMEAKQFLCREAEVPSSMDEERQHRPWVTLMDALSEMVQVWKSLDPAVYTQDSARDDFERFVRDFRGAEARRKSPLNASGALTGDRGTEACTPRTDALDVGMEGTNTATATTTTSGSGSGSANGANSSAKKSLLVTPSARPTPRRVVSKSFSTTGDWKGKQSTPVGHTGSAVPPQVMLSSPASDYTQGASEFSADSNAAGPFNSAMRSLGFTPQHPTMRFAWGSRVAGTAPLSPAPPVPTVSTTAMLPMMMAAAATQPPPVQPSSAAAVAVAATTPSSVGDRSDALMTACTVYITKLPSCFTSSQVRRLLLHFGEFRKVRLCHDDKETTRCGSAEAVAAHQLKFHDLCFGFVEFVEPSSAKAMVEFFRNEVHTPAAFDCLRKPGDTPAFEDMELTMLRNTRTSQARNPIHDQQPTDATRTAPCFFGLIQPEHTIETYADAVTEEEVAAAVKAMEDARAPPVAQQPQQPPQLSGTSSLARTNIFSTTSSPFGVDVGTDATATATAPFSVSALQPMESVHFPLNFPYHNVFAGPHGDAAADDVPVLVEEDDDYDEDDDGLQEYQVQQILQLLS